MKKGSIKLDDLKKLFNKDITLYMKKYKLPLISGLVIVLLALVGIIATYAYYQTIDTTPIIGGTTGEIADLDIRVMAEERDANGNGLNSYGLYPYIPKAGYAYNEEKSYCTNGSTIVYHEDTYDADITAYGHDVCYLYFDSTASLDLTLYVYAENIDSDGYGTGQYTKLETTTLPSIGYTLNNEMSSCENGSTLSYLDEENLFNIDASGKDVCTAYMDAIDVDIQLKLYLQAKSGSRLYYEAKEIPNNIFYELNTSKSACTGTSTLSINNQKVVIAATSKTSCVAYLDVSSGPIIESMEVINNGTTATINLTSSNLGTNPTKYYFSNDDGKTYQESTSASYTFDVASATPYYFTAYTTDANNKGSAINKTEDYLFNRYFDYTNAVQELTIPKDGYYLLEVWGAQGGSATNSGLTRNGGYGSYSKGLTYLTKDSKLYIVTGGQGSTGNSTSTKSGGYNGGGNGLYHGGSGGGATHIATSTGVLSSLVNNKESVLIVAGGGGGGAITNTANCSDGGHGGGIKGNDSLINTCPDTISYNRYSTGGTQTAGGYAMNGKISNPVSSFGIGASTPVENTGYGTGGGGGGWYGGGSGEYTGGAGGSGYIGNNLLISSSEIIKSMYCYNCTTSSVADTMTYSTTNVSAAALTNYVKQGNGYAKVTYIGQTIE